MSKQTEMSVEGVLDRAKIFFTKQEMVLRQAHQPAQGGERVPQGGPRRSQVG
ncbi:MAG: hypothetical protein ACTSV9_02220 [Candidatus Thorarchaeota archaeon]